MAGFLPMVATFERPFRVHQHIGDVLDIAHLPFSATNLKQRVVRCRLRVCRVEQQHAAVPRTKARRQTPILALDVMDNATAWPGQQGRHHKADTLAGSGRCKAQHMFRPIVTQVVALELAEHDTVWRGETSGTNLNWRRPASRAVGGGDFRFPRTPNRHADRDCDRDEATRRRDVSTLDEDMRRVGVVGVPPPKEGGREVNRHAWQEFEPWLPELWLVAKFPRHPLRRPPHGDEHNCEDNNDLTPKNPGRGHG